MAKHLLLLILAGLGIAPALAAQRPARTTDVPPIVLRGLEAYVARGTEAAFETWFVGSAVESDTSMRATAIEGLKTVERQYGRIIGHDVVGIAPIGATVRRVYVVIRYERGPLYALFDCYQTATAWVIPGFLVNTIPQMILPPDMFNPAPR